MTALDMLPIGPRAPKIVNAVIEIPRWGTAKYEYDHDLKVFRLDRVLYSAVHYPAAYGFIPSTLADDGDPVDVLVMTHVALFPGCLLRVRPVGVFQMRDDKGYDAKVLAIPLADPRYEEIRNFHHVPPHFLKEVEHFFKTYKALEEGVVETFGWADRSRAIMLIKEGMTAFERGADGTE